MECNYWIYVNELGTQLLGFSWGPCQNLDIPCCIIILPIHQTYHFGVFPFYGKPHTKSNGVWQYISLNSKKCHEHIPQQIRKMHAKMREFWGVYHGISPTNTENPQWNSSAGSRGSSRGPATGSQGPRGWKIWSQRWGAYDWWKNGTEMVRSFGDCSCKYLLGVFAMILFKLFQYFTLIDNTSFQHRMNIYIGGISKQQWMETFHRLWLCKCTCITCTSDLGIGGGIGFEVFLVWKCGMNLASGWWFHDQFLRFHYILEMGGWSRSIFAFLVWLNHQIDDFTVWPMSVGLDSTLPWFVHIPWNHPAATQPRQDPRFRIAHRPFSELREELRGVQIAPWHILLVQKWDSLPVYAQMMAIFMKW